MDSVRSVRDLEEARFLWESLMPREVVTGLWEVRECFHRHFRRPVHFLTLEGDGRPDGLLPLSWVEEAGGYAYFPGETWHGKTWLEQNLIVGEDPSRLLDAVRAPYHIRYLSPGRGKAGGGQHMVDEIGYLFNPPAYGYDMDNYLACFSGKTLKRLRRETQWIREKRLTWRYDRMADLDVMVAMNISRFGRDSYFYDPRFRKGFVEMVRFFADQGWLRVTTALLGPNVAAVDVGVLYRGTYTLMAGGTDPDVPGIAKVINLHHMEWACEERIGEVDFLCGDFNWKKMFHLKERPLYVAARASLQAA